MHEGKSMKETCNFVKHGESKSKKEVSDKLLKQLHEK